MIIVSKKRATEDALDQVKEYLVTNGFDFHQSTGADRTIIGVIGNTGTLDETVIAAMPAVHQLFRIRPEDE